MTKIEKIMPEKPLPHGEYKYLSIYNYVNMNDKRTTKLVKAVYCYSAHQARGLHLIDQYLITFIHKGFFF
jgi:hypothetical protein